MKKRSLLRNAALAGAAGLAAKTAHASTRLPKDPDNIKVGWVGTGPFSFYGHYISVINGVKLDYSPMRMKITHIWGDDYAKNFKGDQAWMDKWEKFWTSDKQSPEGIAKRDGIPTVCKDFHEMVDEVDAAMIMDYDRAYELAEPFLRQGKPIFLTSPVAVTVQELRKILDLAAENNAAVISGSFTAGMYDNQVSARSVKKDKMRAFFSSSWHHWFTSYANDGLEPVHWVSGGNAKKVQLIGWDGSSGYDPNGIPLSRIHIEYAAKDDNPPVQGMLTMGGYKNEGMWFRVMYDDHSVYEKRTTSSGRVSNFRDFLFMIEETFALNKSVETPDDIMQKLKVVIAAYKSANEGNRVVDIDEVGDYRLPTVRIDKWNETPE